ncbi:hypothetical protein VXS02_06875 [Photobacterium piscicola]|uniref:Thiamine pyrophosphate enzyme N-terminal TPP-binding domain-containing protein n=1 Tax=Photobacterium piscicola TaxID=1378299 RepID=A0ABU6LLV5_9GAMM|nr:hypothetical protein [Photobacterium piscicola]MEC6882859.1 hypothetical protein [Photobacterium piscicola]MEC6900374.1 hypothetical protein [Photobacterium piscicola]
MKSSLTIVEYLIEALKSINLHHVFGVPEDIAYLRLDNPQPFNFCYSVPNESKMLMY